MNHPKWRGMVLLFLASAVMSPVLDDARAASEPKCKDRTPTTWDIEVAPATEPGERLVITGRVVGGLGVLPVAGATIWVYHADAKGNYALPGHEKEWPRLCGILKTNQKGEYRIRTSMPGGYEGYAPHVHFEIWGAGIKHQYAFVNLGLVPGVTPPASRPASGELRTGDNQPVYRGADHVLRCTRDLYIELPPTFFDPPKHGRLGSGP